MFWRVTNSRVADWSKAAMTVPFVLPTVVVGTAYLALIQSLGVPLGIDLRHTAWAILIAHVSSSTTPWWHVLSGSFWELIDPQLGAGGAATRSVNRWQASPS